MLRLPFAASTLTPFLSSGQNARNTNVLFIAVDDLNTRLGCFGDPVAKTPNIDRLAARAVRFERAYCQYPLCNPSRTSLLSGKRPDTTRVLDNRTPPRTYLGDVVFLPEYFRKNGYFTARVGKIAHGLFEDAVTWDISESSAGRPAAGALREVRRNAEKKQKKAAPDAPEGGVKLSWTMTDNADAAEPDGRTALRIIELMEQNKGRPFFLGAGFHKPHLPWVAPKKYFDMYPAEKIKLPDTPPNDRDDIPPIALTRTAGDDSMTERERRQAIAAYHAATTFMDAQVGLLLDALDRLKLWDNTVVVLFGDHGWHLNEHLGLWRKMTVFEESAHAPLMVAAPGLRGGRASPRFVEFVDIYPSLAELCGLPDPPGMEGLSFVPLLKDPQRAWKKAAFTVVLHGKTLGRSVRTDRYRYTEWGDEKVAELYDHETDAYEFTNLAGQAKAARAQSDLKKLLHHGYRAALPSK